ncbi:MAG: 50S ribosomal protein L10 [Anaerolineae bacterium]|nr:50S ribosomal protein L10 [Anaerolineae bacterium]
MAITKEQKVEMLADYKDKMSRSQAIILTDYRGLTVAQISDLRRSLREVDSVFQVIKNTLFELALEQSGLPVPTQQLDGPLAVSYCLADAPPVAKILREFAASTDILVIKGAIVGTTILDASAVASLADLPPREVLRAQLLGAIQGPMGSLVGTLNAPLRELVQVLHARSEQGQEQEAAA